MWQEDPTSRPISGAHGGLPGEVMNLADAGPVLLVSEASMAQLNAWIREESDTPDVADIDAADISDAAAAPVTEPLDILRFRGNVVVDGETPFAEDAWPGVRIGDVEFRTTEVCDRCVMTTLNPVTLEGGKEPIRTLARHRRWDRKTWFGTRLVRTGGGDRLQRGRRRGAPRLTVPVAYPGAMGTARLYAWSRRRPVLLDALLAGSCSSPSACSAGSSPAGPA